MMRTVLAFVTAASLALSSCDLIGGCDAPAGTQPIGGVYEGNLASSTQTTYYSLVIPQTSCGSFDVTGQAGSAIFPQGPRFTDLTGSGSFSPPRVTFDTDELVGSGTASTDGDTLTIEQETGLPLVLVRADP